MELSIFPFLSRLRRNIVGFYIQPTGERGNHSPEDNPQPTRDTL
jgi:hypothetical protein